MEDVSTFRLSLLRAVYVLIAGGLMLMIWPLILAPGPDVSHMGGVVRAMLGTVALLSALGIRYPLAMLPVLFFELIWKTIWVVAFGVPLWTAGRLEGGTLETMNECLAGIVIVAVALPWGYVVRRYVRSKGDRWKSPAGSSGGDDRPS